MNKLTLIFEYPDGPVRGSWSAMSAKVNGKYVDILPDVVGIARGIEVHCLDGNDVVMYNDYDPELD